MIRLLAFIILLPLQSWAAEASFDAATGLVIAEVRIDNRVTGRFGIDTGADRLYIDKSFAEKNNLAQSGISSQQEVVGLYGSTGGYFVTFRTLEVEGQRFHEVNATVIDFKQLSGGQDNHPDGLIGYDILRRMYVTVDYPHQTFDLEINRPRFLSGRTYETIKFRQIDHLIMVEVTFPDGITAPMILDYCASYSVITPKLAERLGVRPLSGDFALVDMELDGVLKTSGVETQIHDLGSFAKSFPRVKIEGILGRTFLAEHKITIDYRTSQIYLHQNEVADKW